MGWTKGKGLGANLEGNLNFVKITHKDDNKGMGFHERDDQWTQHEQNFNALLKSFETADPKKKESNADDAVSADDKANDDEPPSFQGFGFQAPKTTTTTISDPPLTKENVVSGLSLEAQSKKSTKRVHYKKFTRGKDLARYSEQDLANIFGKKALNDQHAFVAAEQIAAASEDEENDEKEKNKKEHVFGVTVIKTGTSITDYFKEKMEVLRLKRQQLPNGQTSSNPFYMYNPEKVVLDLPQDGDDTDFVPQETEIDTLNVKSKKSKRKSAVELPAEREAVEQTSAAVPKAKKAKKSNTLDADQLVDSLDAILPIETKTDQQEPEVVTKVKKSKKSKANKEEQNIEYADAQQDTEVDLVSKEKKSKKSKRRDQNDFGAESAATVNGVDSNEIADVSEKTKRSKKEKRKHADELLAADGIDTLAEVPVKVLKKTKRHLDDATGISENTAETTVATADDAAAPPKKKKKSKSKTANEVTTQPLHFPIFVSTVLTGLYDADDSSVVPDTGCTVAASIETRTPIDATSTSTILSDTYELAKYKAEVFRFFDLAAFAGSSLGDIVGYGYAQNLQLSVVSKASDNRQIAQFWDTVLANKYGDEDAVRANKKAFKKKKYSVKGLEKKNVFRKI